MTEARPYKVAEDRAHMVDDDKERTGIYIRAQMPDGSWVSCDFVALDAKSMLRFLRSRGGNNPWAENIVGNLLGYGNITENTKQTR